ncbi:FG-GAP repeat domain-containing protein [Microbulbifer sp. ARAS458-1]|uniref:FG-GAP repeat domain-containing protein n=1 Tax=Microbulbifer sp. ARAS458-1 TaxID=3140242 RepID=UPI003877C551
MEFLLKFLDRVSGTFFQYKASAITKAERWLKTGLLSLFLLSPISANADFIVSGPGLDGTESSTGQYTLTAKTQVGGCPYPSCIVTVSLTIEEFVGGSWETVKFQSVDRYITNSNYPPMQEWISLSANEDKPNGVYSYKAKIGHGYQNTSGGPGTGTGTGSQELLEITVNAAGGGATHPVGDYEVLTGDVNSDGRTDLYVRPIAGSAPEYVVKRNSNKTFSYVQNPNINGASWAASNVVATVLDFNDDGSNDIFLRKAGSTVNNLDGISGVKDQLIFTSGNGVAHIRAIDSSFKSFFEEVYLWLQDDQYFIDNAEYDSVTKDWPVVLLRAISSSTAYPAACLGYDCWYVLGSDLAEWFPYDGYDASKVYWFVDATVYETRLVPDYSAFNQLAVRYSEVFGGIRARSEIVAGSNAAIEFSDIVEELFGIQYMNGALENPGQTIPGEEQLEPARIRWLRLLRWIPIVAATIEEATSRPKKEPIWRVVDDYELNLIQQNDAFSIGPNQSIVQFWRKIKDADWYATEGMRYIADPINFHRTMLEVWVSPTVINAGMPGTDPGDGGRPWIAYDATTLPTLNADIDGSFGGIRELKEYDPE